MLGSIRFFLAFLVFVSHFPDDGMKLNLGGVSVICFYFISGYLMRKSYVRFGYYSNSPIKCFYLDRFLKLYPQYAIMVLLTVAFIYFFGKPDGIELLNQDLTWQSIFLNLSLLPTNYVFPPFSIEALQPHPIVPTAWSLATEFHFYLLLPFVFMLSRSMFLMALMITLTIQFSSFFFTSEVFNSNSFGYRYIFGTLTIFLYGYSFAAADDPFYRRVCYSIWMVFVFFLLIVAPASNVWINPLVQEVLVGGSIALPLGIFFTTIELNEEKLREIDGFLGDLAYPIFISHFFSFYLTEKFFSAFASSRPGNYITSLLLCLVVSFVLMRFQRSVDAYRINRRGFKSLKPSIS